MERMHLDLVKCYKIDSRVYGRNQISSIDS